MSDAHRDEIAKLEALYADHPEGRVFTHLAEAYRKTGELERARDVLTAGLERHPDYASAHVVLGRVLVDMGRTDEAESEFRRVLDLDSQNLIALRALGDLARDRGDGEKALSYYYQIVDFESSDEVRNAIDEISGRGHPAEGEPEEHETAEHETAEHETAEHEAEEVEVEEDEAPEYQAEESRSEEYEAEEYEAEEYETEEYETEEGLTKDVDALEVTWSDLDVEDSPDLATETIAGVYARQGLYGRAADVYRELVRRRPDDPGLRERLQEMDELARAHEERPAAEEIAVSDFHPVHADVEPVAGLESQGVEWEEDAEPLPGLEVDETDPETGLIVEAGDGGDAAVEAGSPVIRDYLGGLLAWRGEGVEGDGGAEEVESGVGTEADGAGSPAPEAPADDDDLDMFRSWLESLKQ